MRYILCVCVCVCIMNIYLSWLTRLWRLRRPDICSELATWRPQKPMIQIHSESKCLRTRKANGVVPIRRLAGLRTKMHQYLILNLKQEKVDVPVQWKSHRKNSHLLAGKSAFLFYIHAHSHQGSQSPLLSLST